MAQRITVEDLVSEVREQTNEENRTSVTDATDIIPALNRAQNYAADILARFYKQPMLANVEVSTAQGQSLYDIPEDAFESRVLLIETKVNQTYFELLEIDYKDVGHYEITTATTSVPYFWTIIGNQIKILPTSTGAYPLRIWYVKDPLPLALPQGRINLINTASNYIIVDAVGEDLSTEADDLASFVNLIDGQTGILKGTMQIQSVANNRITFKTVPTRTTVLDLNVDTDLAALTSTLTVAEDDYICLAPNTCVPMMKKLTSNFLIQYAVAEIARKLGGDATLEAQVLTNFEKQIERTWVQRPNSLRVTKRNHNWAIPVRRASTSLNQ